VLDVPLEWQIEPHVLSAFWDQARRYEETGLQRGNIFRLLAKEPSYLKVIHALRLDAKVITNKLKKEFYRAGGREAIRHDASLFVQAGLMMRNFGQGYFR